MTAKDSNVGLWIDGCTYLGIAFVTSLNTSFGSDEASKWIAPQTLFWFRTNGAAIVAGLLAVKLFRSTSFAHHQQVKDAEDAKINGGQTQVTTQITQPPPVVTSQVVTSTPPSAIVTPVQPIT